MLKNIDSTEFNRFTKWCENNGFRITPQDNFVLVDVVGSTFKIKKSGFGNSRTYNVDEDSITWTMFTSNKNIPGVSITKNATEKVIPEFNWSKYPLARLVNEDDYWWICGVKRNCFGIHCVKIMRLGFTNLLHMLGKNWEEKYWEKIYHQ